MYLHIGNNERKWIRRVQNDWAPPPRSLTDHECYLVYYLTRLAYCAEYVARLNRELPKSDWPKRLRKYTHGTSARLLNGKRNYQLICEFALYLPEVFPDRLYNLEQVIDAYDDWKILKLEQGQPVPEDLDIPENNRITTSNEEEKESKVYQIIAIVAGSMVVLLILKSITKNKKRRK